MQTSLDCLPCLYKQALYTSRLCTNDEIFQKRILKEVSLKLNSLDLSHSPPENSVEIYKTIAELCKTADPFKDLKKKGTRAALKMRPNIIRRVEKAEDPLLAAIKFAIAGNIIDYGSHQEFDVEETLHTCLTTAPIIDDYESFCKDLAKAERILYLADNCGELVFDGILVEKLKKKIILAVKEHPIINDALLEDALESGLDESCTIISNGTGCPGTPIASCSKNFRKIFQSADLIISKGQGNFETLSTVRGPIYFLLQVKCPIVGQHIAEISKSIKPINTGEMVFMKQKKGG